MSHVITFSETISSSMLKIHRERERELECKQQILLHRPLAIPKSERFIHVFIIRHCLNTICEDIWPPGSFRASTHSVLAPIPSQAGSAQVGPSPPACSSVRWPVFFSEVLSYRALPVKISPELSINTLAWKLQAMSKPVKSVTCWCPAPLLCKHGDHRALGLLWGRATLQQPCPDTFMAKEQGILQDSKLW